MSKNEDRINVIADDRGRKSEVIQFLPEMKNVSVGIKRLSLGDYLVDNRLVFERKTLNDFALSIIAASKRGTSVIYLQIKIYVICHLYATQSPHRHVRRSFSEDVCAWRTASYHH